MSMKSKVGAFAAFAMLGMAMSDSGVTNSKKDRILSVNERRKCFRKGCNNYRPNATDLYCSEECKTLNRKQL